MNVETDIIACRIAASPIVRAFILVIIPRYITTDIIVFTVVFTGNVIMLLMSHMSPPRVLSGARIA